MKTFKIAMLLVLAVVFAAPTMAQTTSTDDAATLFLQARQAFQKQDFATAVIKWQPAAEADNEEAQAMLAQIYANGTQGLPQEFVKALMWNEKAAAQGNARAHLNIGLMYRDGSGVPKDNAKALVEFTRAAEMGDMKAPRYLGLFAADAGDFSKAAIFYQQGAARGDITSQFYLGRAYELGKGVPQDYALALQWYATSAERGDHVASDGMVGLASLYERGLGIAKDTTKASELYKQAAATGNDEAKKAMQRLGAD